MELGMIGLGRMGANMTSRLLQGGHRVVVYDRNQESAVRAGDQGAEVAGDLDDLLARLPPPRAVWVMVPAGEPAGSVISDLAGRLGSGEVVIDGGNSDYRDTIRRGEELAGRGILLVDVGTSGGVWGLKEGYSMMVGGEEAAVERIRPVLETLAPAPDRGWGRVGPSGSGHFVKMVHNGIEYGLMEAYAEGFELLRAKGEFGLDLAAIAGIWRYGSVVRSWLLELIESALAGNPELAGISAAVRDSGEGRWTAREGIELGVPLPAITLALQERFRSRDPEAFAHKLLSAARGQFGGHPVEEK